MSTTGRVLSSEYMHWAKTRSAARYNLATSGVMNFPLNGLPVTLGDLEITSGGSYGYEPLQQALAAKCGVPADCIVAATGTSMANHLALAAVLEPGDEVLIETPTYELLVSAALYLGARVEFFDRCTDTGFAIDPREIARKLTSRTKLIVITNLHNPTSALADDQTLRSVGQIARNAGSYVLVDEVYLDSAFDLAVRTAFQLGEEFIVTSSLTKVYGLSGLRCGWIIAKPELARKIWRLNDLFGVMPAHTAERLSVTALAALDQIKARSRAILDTNREQASRALSGCQGLDITFAPFGTVLFPRLRGGSVDEFCDLLRTKYETSVVPGHFFYAPRHFRVGLGGDTAMTKEGLSRLAEAVNEFVR
ncbi:MAG TPA: pyridoxal phosphate-dependent aminotransferase [Blastocatellia bacterium]